MILMRLKSPKTNTLANKLIERTSSMLDKTESETMHKDEEGNEFRKKQDIQWSKANQKHK